MMRVRQWVEWVILPFCLVIVVDQISKAWAQSNLKSEMVFGPLSLMLHYNSGFFLSGFKDASRILTIILPVSLGGFLIYTYFVIQYFIPIVSRSLRLGLAIFFSAMISNVIDRFRIGAVVDFITISRGVIHTGIFNIADFLQWVGVALFFYAFVIERNALYPPEDRRGRLWIDSSFQGKYCFTLLFVGASFALISGSLSHSFLSMALSKTGFGSGDSSGFLNMFASVYTLVCGIFFISLFLVGVRLSHRIVGPVKSFTRFLDDLINGKVSQFKLRDKDEFLHFEELASRFQSLFHENLGMLKPPLEMGMKAPLVNGVTYQGEMIGPEYFEGKKSWIIFYRYATCPLCALHLGHIKELIKKAQLGGVSVAVVYENARDKFIKDSSQTGKIGELLSSMDIPLIADPDKKLYKLYRTQKSHLGLLSIGAFKAFLAAKKKGYRQGSIDGELNQLPAHFFTDQNGKIFSSHYGKSIFDHPSAEQIAQFLEFKP